MSPRTNPKPRARTRAQRKARAKLRRPKKKRPRFYSYGGYVVVVDEDGKRIDAIMEAPSAHARKCQPLPRHLRKVIEESAA